MVIAFWNINGKDLSDYLIDFVAEQEVDILVLAEVQDHTILEFIKKSKYALRRPFSQVNGSSTKISVLTSYDPTIFTNKSNLYKSKRWLTYQVEIPGIFRFNLASVHFHSKVNWSKESLALECVNFSRDIYVVETESKCYETILIGDFNMNPFEDGLVASNGLNAIQDLKYVSARPEGRNIDGTDYRYFYNPMWNFFGDHKAPLGTHYCRPAGHISQEWNIYDQVMFRGSVGKYLDRNDYVKIVDSIAGEKLTKSFDRPDKGIYSDHLPITLKLKL